MEQPPNKLKEVFNLYKDTNETMANKNLPELLRTLNYDPTEKELSDYYHISDPENKGYITWKALQMLYGKLRPPFSKQDMKEAFEYFDKSQTHKISYEEFKSILTSQGDKLTPEEAESVLIELDKDANGYIDYEEFINIILKTPEDGNAV